MLCLSCQPSRPEPARELAWDVATPESQGLSSDSLARQRDRLLAADATAFLVARHGRIVYEWYVPGFSPTDLHYGAGLAKSLIGGMSLLLALDDGLVELDDPAAAYIPAWQDDPVRSLITLRHLASHTSGLENPAEAGKTAAELTGWKAEFWRRGGDPITVSLREAPVLFEPGTDNELSASGFAALSYAITVPLQPTTTPDLHAYLTERLIRPLGIPDAAWRMGYGKPTRIDGMDVWASWGGVRLTARATGRVGQLLVQKGMWEGERLVDSAWIERVTMYSGGPLFHAARGQALAPTPGWFANTESIWPEIPPDAFVGAGNGHQILVVIPSLELVIVHFGESPSISEIEFWRHIREEIVAPVVRAIAP